MCVCVCVCIYIYIYICIYICACVCRKHMFIMCDNMVKMVQLLNQCGSLRIYFCGQLGAASAKAAVVRFVKDIVDEGLPASVIHENKLAIQARLLISLSCICIICLPRNFFVSVCVCVCFYMLPNESRNNELRALSCS